MPKEKPRVNIGEVIKTYRSQRGLSQGDIERRTGLLRCYLSRVENGHTVPSLETLAKIAEAMDISLADFFPGTETSMAPAILYLAPKDPAFDTHKQRDA